VLNKATTALTPDRSFQLNLEFLYTINLTMKIMKSIFTILFLMTCTYCFGQDSRLFENGWYLNTLIINGTEYFPPLPNYEVQYARIQFDEQGKRIIPSYCNGLSGPSTYQTNANTFSISSSTTTLRYCEAEEIRDFETKYFNFFIENIPTGIFTYTILESGENKKLTIGINNNSAVYTNKVITSVKDIKVKDFSVYPNPAKDDLTIKCENKNFNNGEVEIYDNFGKLSVIENIESFPATINVEKLPAGIYLLKIKSEKSMITKKFIKL
jgi:heat shock protein HslJ